MTKTVLFASAAVLALSAGTAFAGGSHPGAVAHGLAHQVVKGAEPGSVTLYDQTGNDSGIGIVSDNFDSGTFASYDDQAADDFTVPAGHKWSIKEIDAIGVYFNGSGPADGVNLFLFKNKHGKPSGAPLVECDSVTPTTDNFGSFVFKLGKTCKMHAKGGTGGKTYWLSVQANMNFTGGRGEWGWENQTTSEGAKAMWQNPGNGFATGCTSWSVENQCIADGQGDHMFALKGKDSAG